MTNPAFDLTGKTALVTGASSGIGAATALVLADLGARVALGYHNNQKGATGTAEQIAAKGGKAITLQASARKHLAQKGYDPLFGARPLARVIQSDVRDRLTDEILFGKLEHGGTVTIGHGADGLSFSFDGT